MRNHAIIEVDPEIAAILREAAAADLPDPTTLPIAAARAQLTAASLAWNVDLPELAAVADLSMPGPAGAMRLRHFRPRAGARLPLIVYLHGGGWTFGSADTHDRLMRLLALAADAAVIGVDYRLAPEHPYPAPLADCVAAIRCLRDRADELEVDASRMVLAGDSAGANLALASLLALRDADEPLRNGAALFYGCYAARLDTASHARFGGGAYRLSTAEMGWFWRNYLADTPAGTPLAEPLYADLRACRRSISRSPRSTRSPTTRARLQGAWRRRACRTRCGNIPGPSTAFCRSPHAARSRAALAEAGRAIRQLLTSGR